MTVLSFPGDPLLYSLKGDKYLPLSVSEAWMAREAKRIGVLEVVPLVLRCPAFKTLEGALRN